MTSLEGTQLLVPPPGKDEEDSSEALNKLKFHTKKMNWNLKILKDQLTGLEDSGNSLSRQMASMYRTFQEMKEAGEISDVEIEIDEDELPINSRMSDTTGTGSDGLRSYSADDAMDTEDELDDYSDLETDSTTSSGQRKKQLCRQLSLETPENGSEKRKRLTHRKRQSSEAQCESDTDSECDNGQCSCCMSRSSFGSVTPSRRYYFEDRSRADDTSSSSCSDYEEPIKRNTMPLHERHSPFYMPGQGNSSSEEEDMCQEDMEYLLTPHGVTKECRDGDSEASLQMRLSPLGCESPIHYDSHGDVPNVPSGNESEDKSLEDKVKELTVELEQCKEEMTKRTQKRKKSEKKGNDSIQRKDRNSMPQIVQNDNEADLSVRSDSTLNSSVKISDKRKLFEKKNKKDEQTNKPAIKRKDSIGNAMMDKLKAQFESSDAKKSGSLRENLAAKGRRDSIQDKIKMLEHKVPDESDKSDSSTLKSSSESRALQKKMAVTRKLSKDLKHVFEKDLNQNDVSPKKNTGTSNQTVIGNKQCENPVQLLRIPAADKHSKKSNKIAKESKTNGTSKRVVKTLSPQPAASKEIVPLNPAEETLDADYEKRDKVAAKKKFQELQSMWQPKLVVKTSGKQPKPELQKRIQRLQKAALNTRNPGSPKTGKHAVSRAVIHMNKKEKKEGSKTMEFNPDSGEVIIGQTTETDKDGYKTVKLRGNGLVVTLKINPNGKSSKSGDVKVCPSCHKHTDKSQKDTTNEMRLVVPQTLQSQRIIPQTLQHQRTVPQTYQNQRMVPQTEQNQRRVSVPTNTQTIQLPVRKMSTSSITTYVNGPVSSVHPGQTYITVTPSGSYTNQAVPRVYVRPHQLNPQTGQQRITVIPIQAGGDCPRFQLKSVSGGGGTARIQQAKSTTRYTIITPRQQST